MDNIFLEHDLTEYDQPTKGISPRANALVRGVLQKFKDDDTSAERILMELSKYALSNGSPSWPPIEDLKRALEVDGFEWRGEKLVPSTPAPAALAGELSQLELELNELGLDVASQHYRQAYESFIAGNWEAANGQTRSFVEDLLIQLGKRRTFKSRTDASAALQDLRHAGFFDDAEWQMLKGFWQSIQDNGPHHGLSNEEESLFRLHVTTAIARYSLHKNQRQ